MIILNQNCIYLRSLLKSRGNIITDSKIPEYKNLKKISLNNRFNLQVLSKSNNGIDIYSHKFKDDKQIIEITHNQKHYKLQTELIGRIQLKNLFMAMLAAKKSNLKFDKIVKLASKVKSVSGRFEKIGTLKNKSKVILDYAHTPDALNTCLSNLKEQFENKRIFIVFGCGGNRDKDKRPMMGKIANQYCDRVYLTDDNPRNENPKKIRLAIKKTIDKSKVFEISNRTKAIHKAIFDLKTGAYLLEYQDPNTLNWNYVTSITVADSFYTFTNLYSGTYQYTLTDANGCSVTSPQIILHNPTPISSNNLIITETSDSSTCDGDISFVTNGGVAPITHFWTGPNSFSSNSLPPITNLCAGTYYDSVVDANGCNQIFSFLVGVEPPCSPEVEINNIFCDEDSSGLAIVTKTNNAYPFFAWIHDFTGDTISMDTFAVNLPAGDYTFNAYNSGVCPDTSIFFTILAPDVTLIPVGGNIICPGDSTFLL